MVLAGHSKRRPALRRSLTLPLLLLGVVALVASGAPAAWAGPAQEEYELQIPDPRGGGSSPSPNEARSLLGGGGGGPSTGTSYGGPRSATSGASGSGRPGSSNSGENGEALLGTAREAAGSGLLSAGASAAWKAPLGLAVAAILLAVTFAALLAARRSRRIGSN